MVNRARRGFTLYETIAVFVVAAIIAIIGSSVLRSASTRIHRADAEAAVHQVVTSELQFAAVHGAFTSWPDDLTSVDRSISVLSTASVQPGEVSIAVGSDGTLGVASVAIDGFCVIRQVQSALLGGRVLEIPDSEAAACDGRTGLPSGEAPVIPQPF